MKNLIIGQSGGPTAVINASLFGAVKAWKEAGQPGHALGMLNGIEGFLADQTVDLSETLSEHDLALLAHTPAAYLGSCRYKLPEDLQDAVYPAIFDNFREMNIGFFLYIGGNDSMDTVDKLSRYAAMTKSDVRFIGIPKTIDNDLVLTDHTPGFASAAKYVAATVREITLDASVYQQRAVTIVEIMGRHAGWLTAASVLARKFEGDNPYLIYLPETPFSLEQFAADLEHAFAKSSQVVVCVSEGIADAGGTFVCEYSDAAKLDSFGHKMLTGCGEILESFVRERFGVKARSIELNVSQRCSGMLASETDIHEAALAGAEGVRAALAGETGKMIAFRREADDPYQITCLTQNVTAICNLEKKFPREWIAPAGNDILPAFLPYILPLIQGEPEHTIVNGLPCYLYRR
ncbi:MAG: 6-phosphofructokinase [Lachnospiraceae bacterium]|nr:6-phosphofructokinase [Lachnospiraceae bacterium]